MKTEQYLHPMSEIPENIPVLLVYADGSAATADSLDMFFRHRDFYGSRLSGWQSIGLLKPAAPTGSHASAGEEPAREGAATDTSAYNEFRREFDAACKELPDRVEVWHAALAWERQQSTAREASLRDQTYTLKDGCIVTGQRAADLYDAEQERTRAAYSEVRDLTAKLKQAEAETQKWRDAYVTHPPTLIQMEAKLKEAEAKLAARDDLEPSGEVALRSHYNVAIKERDELRAKLASECENHTKATEHSGKITQELRSVELGLRVTQDALKSCLNENDRLRADKEQAVARERAECLSLLNGTISADDVLIALQTLKQRLTQPANRSAEETKHGN